MSHKKKQCLSPKDRFHKLTKFVAEKASPQQSLPTSINPEKEAEATFRYRKAMEHIKKGKIKSYENE